MQHFFVSPDCIEYETVSFPRDAVHKLLRVLRARSGDEVVVLDNSGLEYLVVLDEVGRDRVVGKIQDKHVSLSEPSVQIAIYQGILKPDRFEFVLQKGTELGVSGFAPIVCDRSIPRANRDDWSEKRLARWRKIIVEASEQSRRGRLPELASPINFTDACESFSGLGIIPWEEETEIGLKHLLSQHKKDDGKISSISVFTGPEGGFTREEIELARSKGILSVTLGKRILRAETAGLVAAAAILYEFDELGG